MSNQINLTINGKAVTVAAGTTVIQAAQEIGVAVPHFCWHPGLSIAGVCRFCMVRIEGMPKLQIACNTTVAEGMKVDTVSDDVKDAHKWALEFHLINHPLDCPICDQAGECELQNYYMKVGKYQAQMEENKELKPKTLDVGDTLVLDTERCILCSRCVRFEDEVTKTSTLGIFQRGDKATIGTYPGRKIKHDYSYNLADICPVGAFTAKDFRFKCRVWFLQETKTICPGCSTGCNVTLFQNRNQREYYRLKPRHNAEVNGHWMCDTGRHMFEHLNASQRLAHPMVSGKNVVWAEALAAVRKSFADLKNSEQSSSVALVLTPQYTNEEYESILKSVKSLNGTMPNVYVWRDSEEKIDAFDGILKRGDMNPNTFGLQKILQDNGIEAKILGADFSALIQQKSQLLFVFGPERAAAYTHFERDISRFMEAGKVVYCGTANGTALKNAWVRLPTKVFAEKNGTFMNYKGAAQKIKANAPVFPDARAADEIMTALLNS